MVLPSGNLLLADPPDAIEVRIRAGNQYLAQRSGKVELVAGSSLIDRLSQAIAEAVVTERMGILAL